MTNDQLSTCCGANLTDETYGQRCGECHEPCGVIEFEDADGEPVAMYVDEQGYLRDEPYAMKGGKVTLGEVMIVAWIPVALFIAAFCLQVAGY